MVFKGAFYMNCNKHSISVISETFFLMTICFPFFANLVYRIDLTNYVPVSNHFTSCAIKKDFRFLSMFFLKKCSARLTWHISLTRYSYISVLYQFYQDLFGSTASLNVFSYILFRGASICFYLEGFVMYEKWMAIPHKDNVLIILFRLFSIKIGRHFWLLFSSKF